MKSDPAALKTESRRVWAIAWPVLLTNILNVTVGIIDFKMVGSLGISAIASVGMSRQVMMFVMVLMIAISGGSSVLVAHAHGAGDRAAVSATAARCLLLMVAAAFVLVMPLGLLLAEPMLVALGGSPNVVDLGTTYLHILFAGSVFTMLNFAVTAILLGVGRTEISLILLVGVNTLNVLLNYLLIFGAGPIPALGVAGAALGTITARGLGSIAGLWIVTTPRLPVQACLREGLQLNMPLVGRILFLGGPRSLQGIVRNASRLIMIRIVTLLPDSTRAVSAYSVCMQVRLVSIFVGLAFMSAAMARVGQNLGAGDPDAAERSGWIASGMAAGIMTVVAVILFLFPATIMGFFTTDADVIAMGRTFFRIVAVTQPVMAVAFALGGGLRGGGDPMTPFIYASLSDLFVVVLVGYTLAIKLDMGLTGVALGIAVSAFTRSLPTARKFRQGKWKGTRLRHG